MSAEIPLIVYEEAGSTQDRARDLALAGEAGPIAIMARRQTSGRGRMGRAWITRPGLDLALSILLRPAIEPPKAGLTGMAASIAVTLALDQLGVTGVGVKWPNDVLARGKKIAGILSEARISGSTIDYLIIGIGLNVNSVRDDYPQELQETTTSIKAALGIETDLEWAATLILREIATLNRRIDLEGPAFIPALWEAYWPHKGLRLSREGITGTAERIDSDGSLILIDDSGRTTRVTCGEVEPEADPAVSNACG